MTDAAPSTAEPETDSSPVSHPPATLELIRATVEALAAGSFVKLTLSKPRHRGDPAQPTQAYLRLVEIRHAPHLSMLLRHPDKDITQNHPVAAAAAVLDAFLRDTFANAHLFTTGGDIDLRTNNKGEARLFHGKATFATPVSQSHDRVRRYVLDPAKAPYLQALGIVTGEGKVRHDKADKYKQLQHIIKLLDDVVTKAGLRDAAARSGAPLRVVDMGCGKGYLTFALHDYCNNELGIETTVTGVDRNAMLVATCNEVARQLDYPGLTFACSTVEAFDLAATDIVVALHACDTATDVALFKAITAGARVIMAVPCCQKELRPQLQVPPDERPLLKHDTFKDRYSQMVTDALRGLLLESQGYRTRVIEFISDAHTHRNVMIVGVLDPTLPGRAGKRAEAAALQQRYGIARQELETLLIAAGRIDASAVA